MLRDSALAYPDRVRASDLPKIRYQSIAHFLLVFFIPCQIFLQELLLVENSPCQNRDGDSKHYESPPGAERERDADDHDHVSQVLGMSNVSVETGRHHFLTLNYLDRSTSIAVVSSEREKGDEQAKHDQRIS